MTDMDLKRLVESALDWEPSVNARDIGVSVDDGVVTLRGNVDSYSAKVRAERVTLHVYGAKGVANDLKVHVANAFACTDTEIVQAAVAAIDWNAIVPKDSVMVAVSDGWLTLKGTAEWQYQKEAAGRAVRDLTGVKGVTNEIVVQSRVKVPDVREKIEAAFKRSAEIDARRINVTATDGKVILSGHVRSWAELQEAEHVAWAAPGVNYVEDRLRIVP